MSKNQNLGYFVEKSGMKEILPSSNMGIISKKKAPKFFGPRSFPTRTVGEVWSVASYCFSVWRWRQKLRGRPPQVNLHLNQTLTFSEGARGGGYVISFCLLKVIVCGFHHGKSPFFTTIWENIDTLFFPNTLSKSKS